MAESVGQSENKDERDLITREDLEIAIKKEVEVKPEPHECVVCLIRSQDTYDIYCTKTIASGASLHSFLSKYTRNELGHAQQCPKYVCKSCCDLINVLEQAEVEYNKLKETFEAIISKNPLFHINLVQPIQLSSVKNELEPQTNNVLFDDYDIDSEDEPLSLTKKKRRKPGKKRKKTTPVKRKTKVKPSLDESKDMDDLHPLDQPLIKRKKHWSSKVKVFVHNLHEIKKLSSSAPMETSKTDVYKLMETSKINAYELHDIKDIPLSDTEANKSVTEGDCELWECGECGACGGGGAAGEAAHAHAAHAAPAAVLADVKKEDSSDGSQNQYNGFEPKIEMEMDIEFEADGVCDDDDDSSNFVPEEENIRATRKNKILLGRPLKSKVPVQKKPRKPRESKVMHKCDECDAKYSSLARLEQHKLKHDGSKPPYICEVCGAHYKHKRACDIHIQLHKGISDWKCEECNKLFPSKGALQRHNNIHTGKLNYQCDLCGKSFIHTSSFKMHKLSHSGVKPHACDVCGLALMTRSHLKRHKRVHSGEKRHECTVCGKRFSERYNLAAHSKSHEAGAAGAGGAGGAQAQAQAPRRHLFRCPFCPDRFERRYMLERHMSVVHGRALERPPPTPRNTMSKLLKAQAQGPRRTHDIDSKDDRSPDSRSTPVTPQKLIAQLSSQAGSAAAATSWSSAYAEFNLRAEFPH